MPKIFQTRPCGFSGLFPDAVSQRRVSEWTMRGLGFISLIAFWSLWTQLGGLAGPNGLAPAGETMDWLREQFTSQRTDTSFIPAWLRYPTLGWISADYTALRLLCGLGLLASALLVLMRLPWLCIFVCWGCYLSLCNLISPFMNFQWDALLVETLFMSLFLVPILAVKPGFKPHPLGIFLLRLLLLKLIFSSGVVKLSFGDPTWWNFAALDVHYQTQPLPLPSAWHAHHLPDWLHRVAIVQMFAVELILALLIFAGRRPRQIAAGGILLLQGLIACTGNYTFFNLLTGLLCLPLLDDRLFTNQKISTEHPKIDRPVWMAWLRAPAWVIGGFLIVTSVLQTVSAALPGGGRDFQLRKPLQALTAPVAAYRSINEYGLFRVMTTTRPELTMEGSADGKTWIAYSFRLKPSALDRPPGAIAPHQPRLDWQLWFEALSWEYAINRGQRPIPSPWAVTLMKRVFAEEQSVLALLETNPFPENPPEYIRFRAAKYRFTSPEEREATGNWWYAEPLGDVSIALRKPADGSAN